MPESPPPPDLPAGVTVIPTYPMYSPGQIAGATFLGGPLGGAWLLSRNYQRLGEPGKARTALGLGVVATIVLFTLAFAIPKLSSIGLLPVFLMWGIAKALQDNAYHRHLSLHGPRGSSWRTAGVGLASLAVCMGILFGIAIAYGDWFGLGEPERVMVGKSEVIYADGATQAEAQAVGDALVKLDYFPKDEKWTVEVLRDHGRHVVAFVTQDYVFNDDRAQLSFHGFAEDLSRGAFANQPVDIWLTDDSFEPHRKLSWTERPRQLDFGDGHTVEYFHGGQEAEAKAVGHVLEQADYFEVGQPATVSVTRAGTTPIVGFIVADFVFDDDERKTAFHAYANALSKDAFGGRPVDLWLEDGTRLPRVKLTWQTRPQ
jgi:hypothetical protein